MHSEYTSVYDQCRRREVRIGIYNIYYTVHGFPARFGSLGRKRKELRVD
jgi:hypothetical protein